MGKPVLDDLRNGLLTAPILLALESPALSDGERLTLKTAVESLFTDPSDETIATIQSLLIQCSAVEETRNLAHRYISEALQALGFIADNREKQALLTVANYILERRS